MVTTVAIDGRFALGERRGIGKGSLELLRGLRELALPLQFDVVTDRAPDPDLFPPHDAWRWSRLRPGAYPLWEQVALPVHLSRTRPDIVHCLGNTAPLLGGHRTQLILTVHDFIFMEPWQLRPVRQRLGRQYRRFVVPRAIRRADWIVADSNAIRQQLVQQYPAAADRMSVIGIPVAERFFSLATPRAQGDSEPEYFIAFGGIDPRKNVDRIVSAFALVRASRPTLRLVLIGAQGHHRGGGKAGVEARPYVSEDELVGLYASARALVYPSLREGFGVPILEAMALGVPVITSDREPMRELAGDAGLLVDPESTQAIREAMEAVLRGSPEIRSRALGGRQRASAFRRHRIAEQVAALYTALAHPNPVLETRP